MDLSKYKSVGEWYRDYHHKYPTQVPAALTRAMKQYNLSLEEAYKFLVRKGSLIEIDNEKREKGGSSFES